jgi:hypothetical protein
MRAIGSAAKIHFRIENLIATAPAPLATVVFKEFYWLTTAGAVALKHIIAAPVAAVLSRTLHDIPPFVYINFHITANL